MFPDVHSSSRSWQQWQSDLFASCVRHMADGIPANVLAESGEMADGGALQPTGTGGDVLMRKHRTREKSLSREGPKLSRRRPSTTHVKFP